MILNPTAQTYDNLLLAYRFMNEALFSSILPPCLITLQREKKTLGYFCSSRFNHVNDPLQSTDEIALNPQFFRSSGRDDREVVSTLVHEMCHLWQHHYGNPGRARYHNNEWGKKMKEIGLIPSSTGAVGGRETGDHMSHYIKDNGPFSNSFKGLTNRGFKLQWIEISERTFETFLPLSNIGDPKAPEDISSTEITEIPKKADKSNRLKYTCSECNLNAWAKPGANLVCGDCEKPMCYTNE